MKFNRLSRFFLLLLPLTAVFSMESSAQQGISFREQSPVLRTAGLSSTLPCAGSQIFYEDFEGGLPSGWIVLDGDNLDPRPEMGLVKGWQTRQDYADTSNTVMVSPSWYDPVGQSDDWLITPPISLGNNSCLSWTARSQDQFFKEAYEVRISTSTTDTSAFLADSALVTVGSENASNTIRTVNLAAYAGQNVYFAFRQTSNDKFVLVLDEVKVSNVNNIDIGVVSYDYGTPDPGDTVRIEIEVGNFGSDTITSFNALFSVEGGTAFSMAVDSISLAPNATIFVDHDAYFVSDSVDKFYDICLWTSLPNNSQDEDLSNDTLCSKVAVGSPVGRPEPELEGAGITVFPNPFSDRLNLEVRDLPRRMEAELRLFDLMGRAHLVQRLSLSGDGRQSIATGDLPPGMYLLQITSADRVLLTRRLLHR